MAQSLGTLALKKGDEMIITEMEHHANIVPLLVCERVEATILVCPTLPDGSLDRDWLSQNISKDSVKLISLTAISNTLGTINPIEEIISEAKEHGNLWYGWSTVPHQRTNFAELGCDFFTFSVTKFLDQWALGYFWVKKTTR